MPGLELISTLPFCPGHGHTGESTLLVNFIQVRQGPRAWPPAAAYCSPERPRVTRTVLLRDPSRAMQQSGAVVAQNSEVPCMQLDQRMHGPEIHMTAAQVATVTYDAWPLLVSIRSTSSFSQVDVYASDDLNLQGSELYSESDLPVIMWVLCHCCALQSTVVVYITASCVRPCTPLTVQKRDT